MYRKVLLNQIVLTKNHLGGHSGDAIVDIPSSLQDKQLLNVKPG
jgi:hypothetical protein